MAEIAGVPDNKGLHFFETVTGSDTTAALQSDNGGFLAGAVEANGTFGDDLTVQASLDGTNWYTAKDIFGNDMVLSAAGYYEFSIAARYVRASAGASITDVDVTFFLT